MPTAKLPTITFRARLLCEREARPSIAWALLCKKTERGFLLEVQDLDSLRCKHDRLAEMIRLTGYQCISKQ